MKNQPDNPWSSKSIGSRFGHNFFYFMVTLGGRRLAYFFLYFIVFYYTFFFKSVREKTDPYLLKRFPNAGILKRFTHRYHIILNLGKALVDRAVLGIKGTGAIRMSFENPKDLADLKALNSGFIIMMSHTGCWQIVMSALKELKKPVNLVMLRSEQDIDKHYFEHGKAENIFKIIDPEQFLGGTLEMIEALKKDEIVCIMADRTFKSLDLAVETKFLGQTALFPFSPYKIASTSGKPAVILYSYKSGPNTYRLRIPQIIHVPQKLGKKKEAFLPFVRIFVNSLEDYIHEFPYQFFNFYDMWKRDEP